MDHVLGMALSSRTPRRLESGTTLIEVLIAVTVTAIGILGIGAMLALTLREAQRSAVHSASNLLSQSIIDRMSANVAGVWLGAYDGDIAAGAQPGISPCSISSCTPAQLAAADRAAIARELLSLGAAAAADIACTPAVGGGDLAAPFAGSCDLQLGWNELEDDGVQGQLLIWRFTP